MRDQAINWRAVIRITHEARRTTYRQHSITITNIQLSVVLTAWYSRKFMPQNSTTFSVFRLQTLRSIQKYTPRPSKKRHQQWRYLNILMIVNKRKAKFLTNYLKSCNSLCIVFAHVAKMNWKICQVALEQQPNVAVFILLVKFCCCTSRTLCTYLMVSKVLYWHRSNQTNAESGLKIIYHIYFSQKYFTLKNLGRIIFRLSSIEMHYHLFTSELRSHKVKCARLWWVKLYLFGSHKFWEHAHLLSHKHTEKIRCLFLSGHPVYHKYLPQSRRCSRNDSCWRSQPRPISDVCSRDVTETRSGLQVTSQTPSSAFGISARGPPFLTSTSLTPAFITIQ